jgi:hypothetical protein
MDRQGKATEVGRRLDPSRSALVGMILILGGGVLWIITVAPLVVGSALTFGLAAAWCRRLEHHPDEPPGVAGRDPADETTASR